MVFRAWRDPLLVLQLTLDQAIARRAIGNDVSLADDARSLHPQRTKDSLLQHVAVKRAGHAMDQNAQRQISEIAVAPVRARRKGQRNRLHDFEKFVFAMVFAEIEILSDSR